MTTSTDRLNRPDAAPLNGQPHAAPDSPATRRELLARLHDQQRDDGQQHETHQQPPTSAPADDEPAAPLSQPRILDATERCLRQRGYDGTTIRRIASELDCAVGTIYRHFKDKRALLNAVTQRRFAPIAEALEQGGDFQQSAADYLRTAGAEPQQYRLMFWLASVGNHESPGVPAVIQRIIAAWGEALGGERRAQRFWAELHGMLMLGLNPDPAQITAQAMPTAEAAPKERDPAAASTDGGEDVTLL